MTGRLPDFVCLGGMRCGSTTLWSLLRQHPGLFLPEEKELHFFDDVRGRYDLGPQWYAEQFQQASSSQLAGEVTPSYLYHDYIPERLFKLLPDAKLIVILRDPVKRAWSHYWLRVLQGYEGASFETALSREADRQTDPDLEHAWRYAYAGWSRYTSHLRRFCSRFDRERMLVVFLEDFLRDVDAAMAEVCRFLGVTYTGQFQLPHTNAMTTVRMRWLHRACSYRPTEATRAGTVLDRVQSRAVRTIRRWNIRRGKRAVRSTTERDLRRRFRSSDEELSEWLGRSLPWAPK